MLLLGLRKRTIPLKSNSINMLSKSEGKLLVKFARDSIESYFQSKKPDFNIVDKFSTKQGVFVTLHKNGELRGCIGYPEPVLPLNKAIYQAALAAAFQDPRFPPVRESEMKEIILEISVLTVPELICVDDTLNYPSHVDIGKDGLIIRKDFCSGLLLPQVFTEYNASQVQALEMLCQKACLAIDSWKKKDCKLFKFQAQIFSEEKNN
jgi:uncharacterized protein (TIGR00296 family)